MYRVYYLSRFRPNPDRGSNDAYEFVGTWMWNIVPQTLGPQTDAHMRDTASSRHYKDGSFDHVHAITVATLPPPAPNSGADSRPGPYGSYRQWPAHPDRPTDEAPFFMPGVN